MGSTVQHVFIIGAKGLGGYGGYETFVRKLIDHTPGSDGGVCYHVVCKANGYGALDERTLPDVKHTGEMDYMYRGAHCHKLHVPPVGSAQAVIYDYLGLRWALAYCRREGITQPVFYVLSCRLGPVIRSLCREIHRLGGRFFLNPDGHEWMRAKWNRFIRAYFRYSERKMALAADLVVCDSREIERYIRESYGLPESRTTFLAYGAETYRELDGDEQELCLQWLNAHGLEPDGYYLLISRFVPENSFECILSAFMASNSKRKLVIVATENERFQRYLEDNLHFSTDPRIRLVGTVYDEALLHGLRRSAHGYLHGHTVGGTNPGLLEAMADGSICLVRDVAFNREVALDAALYWSGEAEDLRKLLERTDAMSKEKLAPLGLRARARMESAYRWDAIAEGYLRIFTDEKSF